MKGEIYGCIMMSREKMNDKEEEGMGEYVKTV